MPPTSKPVGMRVFFAHMRGCKDLSGQVCNPVMKLVVTSGDEAASFEIQGVGNG